jgi:spore coat protein JB
MSPKRHSRRGRFSQTLTSRGLPEGAGDMSERESLLRKINANDFAMWELHIFLDTHPDNSEALAMRDKYAKKRDELTAEYTAKFGPLNMKGMTAETKWKWISNPWPWEIESNEEEEINVDV